MKSIWLLLAIWSVSVFLIFPLANSYAIPDMVWYDYLLEWEKFCIALGFWLLGCLGIAGNVAHRRYRLRTGRRW